MSARSNASTIRAVSRLLILCRHPHGLSPAEGEAWLSQALEQVLRHDGLHAATLTRLANPSLAWSRQWDWLVELRPGDGFPSAALDKGGACNELLADLRLLGMQPGVALADERAASELRP